MSVHSETKILPFTPQQLFHVVSKVDQYPDFLPWVTDAQISDHQQVSRHQENFLADLTMGYKLLTYPYQCRVHLSPFQRIDIDYVDGPFSHLMNYWTFTPLTDTLTELGFFIDFQFKSFSLQMMVQPLFTEIVKQMTQAFEERAIKTFQKHPPVK